MALGPSEATGFDADANLIHLLVNAVTEYAITYERFFTHEDQQRNVPAQILATAKKPDATRAKAGAYARMACASGPQPSFTRFRTKAGRHIGFVQVTRDNTQRKATQDALLESERRFRILVRGVTDYAICMIDPSGIVINWNTGAERIKGYTADEIIGQHISRFFSREDRAAGLPAADWRPHARGQIRNRRLARAQGRHALLGCGRARRHS